MLDQPLGRAAGGMVDETGRERVCAEAVAALTTTEAAEAGW